MSTAPHKFVISVDSVVDLIVDVDGDADVNLDAPALTHVASNRRASTFAGQVHVAVAINVHVADHDHVHENVGSRWSSTCGELY